VLGSAARRRRSCAQGSVRPEATGGLPQAGQCGRGPGGGGELAGGDDQVVDQARVRHRGQAAQHVGTGQPARIGFALYLVPDADQLAAARHLGQRGQPVVNAGGGQVGPADHPGDQVAGGGQGEQFRGLAGHGDGLHDDARGHAAGPGERPVVAEQEVAAQRREGRPGDPVLVAYPQVPQVVVGVDDPHSVSVLGTFGGMSYSDKHRIFTQ
jgi:hypothetical protein